MRDHSFSLDLTDIVTSKIHANQVSVQSFFSESSMIFSLKSPIVSSIDVGVQAVKMGSRDLDL